jgi:hypothetical protein
MSALATIVGGLGELTESELQQLYLMVGVRLGNPGVLAGAKPQQPAPVKNRNAKSSSAKGTKTAPSSKGNPKRKSQWANHPLYQEYSRLKKVVENQAKEAKSSFNAVDTAESRAYREAFTHWVEAKSAFRDHREDGQNQSKTERNADEDEESSEEEEEEEAAKPPPPSSSKQVKPATSKPSEGSSGKSRAPATTGKVSPK